MLTADGALTFVKFGNNDFLNIQSVNADRESGDVNNGIYSAYLMKMNFIQRLIVSLSLSFGNNLKYF